MVGVTQTCAVAIIGGAIMGTLAAYFLARRGVAGREIAVIERDRSYRHAATALSAAGIRQQFSLAQNIRLARASLAFYRDFADAFGVSAGLEESGYLLLAPPRGRAILAANHATQLREGADIVLEDSAALARRYPWLNVAGVAAGATGLSGEGWFDPWSVLQAVRQANRALGIVEIEAEVAAIDIGRRSGPLLRLRDGEAIGAEQVVNAAGPNAGRVAALAGIVLPIEPRKRTVFRFACERPPGRIPLTVDISGTWFRSEGEGYLCGKSPDPAEDGPADPGDFEPDYQLFEELLWPLLAERVPVFESIRMTGAWAGHYDFNRFDQNAVIGPCDAARKFWTIGGFSGHGVQQAPAAAEALAAMLTGGPPPQVEVAAFGFARFAKARKLLETNVI